jgi:hypothetical protein
MTTVNTAAKRDLYADLTLCESIPEWIAEGSILAEYDRLTETGCDLVATFVRKSDAEFAERAREGWPESIRRAIAAEAEVERLRDENHTLTLTVAYQDEWKAEAERLRSVLYRFDDRKHAMMPRSQMARIAKEALDASPSEYVEVT